MLNKPEKHIASVIVVNHSGQILLQLRDGNTNLSPHKWCLPGGHVEPGEKSIDAAQRELREETELDVNDLRLCWQGSEEREDALTHFAVYFSLADVSDTDVVCHEGEAMRFVAPREIPRLEFARIQGIALREFLESGHYRQIRDKLVV